MTVQPQWRRTPRVGGMRKRERAPPAGPLYHADPHVGYRTTRRGVADTAADSECNHRRT